MYAYLCGSVNKGHEPRKGHVAEEWGSGKVNRMHYFVNVETWVPGMAGYKHRVREGGCRTQVGSRESQSEVDLYENAVRKSATLHGNFKIKFKVSEGVPGDTLNWTQSRGMKILSNWSDDYIWSQHWMLQGGKHLTTPAHCQAGRCNKCNLNEYSYTFFPPSYHAGYSCLLW